MKDSEQIFKFDLLENALDFINSAIEHLTHELSKKDLKYGILHLSAGIDLVFKYLLSLEHWTLLFQNIDDAKVNRLKSGDFVSVDSKKSTERLKEICGIKLDDRSLTQLKHLRERRNKLEHFGITESSLAVKASSMKVLNFVFELINDHVDLDEISAEEMELICNIKNNLIKFEDFIAERWKKIKKEVDYFKESTAVTICPNCYQSALAIDGGNPTCLFCNFTGNSSEVAEEFVNNVLGISCYEAVAQGGDDPLNQCPDCGSSTLVNSISEDDNEIWICFSCGLEVERRKINYCETCGTPYFVSENDIGMCKSCIDYRMR